MHSDSAGSARSRIWRAPKRAARVAVVLALTAATLEVALAAPAHAAAPNALTFDGVASYVNVPDSPALRLPSTLTVEAWVKVTSAPRYAHVVAKESWELSVLPSGGGFQFLFEKATSNNWVDIRSPVMALNQWYSVAATYDGTVMRLFVEGQPVAGQAMSGNIDQTTMPLRFGSSFVSGDFFTGLIDEVRLSNVVRYSATYTPPPTPLTTDGSTVGLWHLDDGSGTTATDSSGNGRNGTLVNGPVWTTDSPFASPSTPPAISGATAGGVSGASATISWTTDEPANAGVSYGLTSAYGSTAPLDPTMTTAHSVPLVALAPNTTYHYRVESADVFGNRSTSADLTFTTNSTVPPEATTGTWSPLVQWPLVAVHQVLMRTGEILMWDAWEIPSKPYVYNPTTGAFTAVPNPFGIFCAGHATLPDGRILIMGGHLSGDTGIPQAFLFDPTSRSWTRVPDMALSRWYPSATTMPDGRILAISGETVPGQWAENPEIYDANTNAWTTLTGISTDTVHEEEYPLSFLQPNGKVLTIAPGSGSVRMIDPGAQTNAALPNAPMLNESAAMYRPGKVLVAGGGPLQGTSVRTAAVIDTTAASPAWRSVASMANGRYMHNLTLMADGSVLAVGGSTTAYVQTKNGTLTTERWNPTTETWTSMASMLNLRMYHSTSVLLPDGRVIAAGGGRLTGTDDYPTMQIFSPPYLFKGPRPTISAAPSSAGYGSSITVQTPDAASISSVALVSMASVTHTLDQNQRYVPLTFTAGAGSLNVQAPANANLAPPGYYMLTIVNGSGVPSVAATIQITPSTGGDTTPPRVSVTAPAAGATVSGNAVTLTASATDNVGVASVQLTVDGKAVGAPVTNAPYTTTWNSTSVPDGAHNIGAVATDLAGNTATAAPVSVTVSNAAPSPPTISGVGTGARTPTTAVIVWTTDRPTDSQVRYGLTSTYNSTSALDPTLVTNHQVTLTGLSPGTTYHYQVVSRDSGGLTAQSSDATFTTPATALFCNLTAPAAGSTVSGTVSVTADAGGGTGVAGVQFKVDGANLGAEDTTSPYATSWNTTTVGNGTHTLTAVARDSSGVTVTSSSTTVTVSNAAPTGLVAAYSFNEGSGITVNDASGSGNGGTTANTTWATGKYGGALSFNGSSSWVTVADASSLDLTNGMTLEAWVRPSVLGTTWASVIAKEAPSYSAYGLYANTSNRRPTGYVHLGNDDQTVSDNVQVPLNTWTHLAVTYDGLQLRLYVNGAVAGTKSVSGSMAPTTGPMRIGGNSIWGEWFAGLIDEVRIYNRALSQAQVQTDMATPL